MGITFIVLYLISLGVAVFMIWLTIWSSWGVKEDTTAIRTTVEEHMDRILNIMEMQLEKLGTVELELDNLGIIRVFVHDQSEDETVYQIDAKKSFFKKDLLISRMNRSDEMTELEEELFGEEEAKLASVGSSLRVRIPSVDKEKCRKFMKTFIKWLDAKYFEELKKTEEELEEGLIS